ncbi:DNA cross-link repair 1A protein-like [Babylonia areolata]|uniref:DNA cross-link repair 1A protein-like n=1 Tax=Babylonia areolata TaxID=304850 RepID=UPI003FD020F5
MENEDEDVFSFRSLKKVKTKDVEKQVRPSCPARKQVSNKSKKKNSGQNFRKTRISTLNTERNENDNENQKLDRRKVDSECTEAHDCTSRSKKNPRQNLEADRQLWLESERTANSNTQKTVSRRSVNNHQLPNTNSLTDKATENHGDSSYTSDVSEQQDSEYQIQAGRCFSVETPKTSEFPEGKNESKESMKAVSNILPKESEEGRCPFCQMPFRALSGQSPNWHTMECMDLPLKSTHECPAGLTCDNTVPSHYRRYTHSLLALHFAGQHEEGDCTTSAGGSRKRHLDENQVSVSPHHSMHDSGIETKRASPQQNQLSKKKPRPRKTKQPSTKSETAQSTTGSGLSLSQGSQSSTGSSSSIKAYFSPSGKKSATPGRHCESKDRGNDMESDPVLRLLVVSDSDSDESIEHKSRDEIPQNKTLEYEMDWDEQTPHHQPLYQPDSGSERAGENSCKLKNITEDLGCGFTLEETDYEEAVAENISTDITQTENAVHSSFPTKSDRNTHFRSGKKTYTQQSSDISQSTSTLTASTSATICGMQKQTSLFSFFKPHCHSANASKQQAAKGVMTVEPKLLFTKEGTARRRSSFQAGRKPMLTKSTSEPVQLMRVPSPPPDRISVTNASKQTGGSKSAVSTSSSFKNSSGRQCPFYKRLPGTAITVDAFCYGEIAGCQAYVLTHFHYDHYQGLTKRFSQPIYCSQVTGNLVEQQLGVNRKWINRLPMNQPQQVTGVWLTLMEANHCPGAVIILFELPNGKKLLHTGDFRADPRMEEYPPLVGVAVDELYLDTTYCDPSYAFPPQREAVQFAVSTALKTVEREPHTLIVCGAYTIGKERIFIALAEALRTKVCVQPAKKRVLDCLEDSRLKNMVSLKWTDGCVHVLPMRQLNAKGLDQHLLQCPQFTSVLAFEPTGWTHSNRTLSLDSLRPKFSARRITVYGVPYSEHSSFLEMKRFVQFLRPKKILPTVNNGNASSRRKMEAVFKQWLSEGAPQAKQGQSSRGVQPSLGSWLGKPS